MRNEKEIFDLIINVAKGDEKILAVYMNGSRTNPNVTKDAFQDYDIVYVVKDTSSYISNYEFIKLFGNLLIMQEPDKLDKMLGEKIDYKKHYTYLMLFDDGVRIDLRIQNLQEAKKTYIEDSLTMLLYDRNNILPPLKPSSDINYWVKKPTEEELFACCNDFWWCLQNVTKGIARDELPYAKEMFEVYIRGHLNKVVSWWIGKNYDFSISTGKMGKFYKKYLPADLWKMYEETYSDSNYENFWNSIEAACNLFSKLAKELYFNYNNKDEENMRLYIKKVRRGEYLL